MVNFNRIWFRAAENKLFDLKEFDIFWIEWDGKEYCVMGSQVPKTENNTFIFKQHEDLLLALEYLENIQSILTKEQEK